ncbi:helix-turn-helix domain-containing protein [Corallococcus sp. AB050B]|nr:helix-turn-helix domain-containing protein [Corallococcus sp. AB050B]
MLSETRWWLGMPKALRTPSASNPPAGPLEDTHLPVSEVCLRSGYLDQASFSRLLKRKTGLTPGDYRSNFLV